MNIVVMPGDDIGPEIVRAALTTLRAADAAFSLGLRLDTVEVGMASYRAHGTTLTDAAMQAAIDADGVILGPCGMTDYPPRDKGGINVPGSVRKRLELYANLRPARSRAGVPDARRGLDALIVRENTEGFYADRNMFQGKHRARSKRPSTRRFWTTRCAPPISAGAAARSNSAMRSRPRCAPASRWRARLHSVGRKPGRSA